MPIIKSFEKLDKRTKIGLVVLAVIIAGGIPLTLKSLSKQTVSKNNAAEINATIIQPVDQATGNINNTMYMSPAKNADGTMALRDSSSNWSKMLPDNLLGKLDLAVIDSVQNNNGSPMITNLKVIVAKAEVRNVFIGTPVNGSTAGRAVVTPGQWGPVDHWETLKLRAPLTLDLAELAKTQLAQKLGLTDLAGGRYSEIRLYVKSATVSIQERNDISLTMNGYDNIIRIVKPFVIEPGMTTKLTLEFDAQKSVVSEGGSYLFKPYVRSLNEER